MNVMYFPRNLCFLRRINGYTQEEISVFLNICRQSYSNYEHARRFPSMDIILSLSSFFQVPLEALFSSSLPESGTFRPPGLALSPRGSAGAGFFASPSPAASPQVIYRSAALAA